MSENDESMMTTGVAAAAAAAAAAADAATTGAGENDGVPAGIFRITQARESGKGSACFEADRGEYQLLGGGVGCVVDWARLASPSILPHSKKNCVGFNTLKRGHNTSRGA